MPYRSDLEETLYNAKWLRKTYRTHSAPQIAEMLECTRSAVLDNLRKHGIPIERGRYARRVGSHVPRPRKRFIATLHNEEWLQEHYVEKRLSASQVAHLVGCSVPSVIRALHVVGIRVRPIGEALFGRPNPKRKKPKELAAIVSMRWRARRKTPPGPCAICQDHGRDVNHKDRDPYNEDPENLERLCVTCHRRQHAIEERVMIEWLKERGVNYLSVHEEARKRLLRDGFTSKS